MQTADTSLPEEQGRLHASVSIWQFYRAGTLSAAAAVKSQFFKPCGLIKYKATTVNLQEMGEIRGKWLWWVTVSSPAKDVCVRSTAVKGPDYKRVFPLKISIIGLLFQ